MTIKSLLAAILLTGASVAALPAVASIAPDRQTNAEIGLPADDGSVQLSRRGRGQDDGPGHVRRCRGCDDGPNHTSIKLDDNLDVARRGADDPAGDDRRGRGRGADDAPNHG